MEHLLTKALFSNFVAFEKEKMINLCFHVKKAIIFEKRTTYLIEMRKISFSTLKSAFGF